MPFNSIRYFLLLGLVFMIFWTLPGKFRKALLLIAGYVFYIDSYPPYGLLLLGLTIMNFLLGRRLAKADRWRRRWLWFAIGANLAVLGFFKYANFILGNSRKILGLFGEPPALAISVVLPLGISFITFGFLHYLIDVFRGRPPVRSWIDFAIFGSFFPTIIAGPIKRVEHFVPQLSREATFVGAEFRSGLSLIIQGLFKKMVLADNLMEAVQYGFGNPGLLGIADTWMVVLGYTLQIYFDFSGYTDIARGSACLLGFDIPINFNRPYSAKNISEFWQRWHITLSTWLRDYLFLPITYGLMRKMKKEKYFGVKTEVWGYSLGIVLTMSLAGLWHGAGWPFIVWGMIQGFGLVVHRIWRIRTHRRRAFKKMPAWGWFSWGLTFLFINLGWVFFRAATVSDAFLILRKMFAMTTGRIVGDFNMDYWITILIIAVGYGLYVRLRPENKTAGLEKGGTSLAWVGRIAFQAFMILAILAFHGGQSSFIYFRF